MPSFRSAKSQARHAVKKVTQLGTSKQQGESGIIRSVGTVRAYEQSLRNVVGWMHSQRIGHSLNELNREMAERYLSERCATVSQSTLDQDRQALQAVLSCKLSVIKSQSGQTSRSKPLSETSRIYSSEQFNMVLAKLSVEQRFAVQLSAATGLRAHEIYTLRRISEQPKSAGRPWDRERHLGQSGIVYTARGKGGLVREIVIPNALARELESYRLPIPATIRDRGITYKSYYALPGGQRLSAAFSKASKSALGWSKGLHSVRHMFAQQNMLWLMRQGKTYDQALLLVSQKLAHFRPAISERYLF
ncbi:site-specific integrase [Alteromonas sp. 1_MG-2023]|uniref:site-specific integrase n=1 Tax=Alteromonas sp. 1_MG-2023 TaxID=3062669 RepID=UPI0026E48799|nr:site-specific integrase [Alteromonas sp. 1_MG-2023]MDO6477256.1 site-specific integrase [Alteromonas sp. 1_MG-2023]